MTDIFYKSQLKNQFVYFAMKSTAHLERCLIPFRRDHYPCSFRLQGVVANDLLSCELQIACCNNLTKLFGSSLPTSFKSPSGFTYRAGHSTMGKKINNFLYGRVGFICFKVGGKKKGPPY